MSRGRGDIDALLFDFGGVIIEIDFDRVFARWGELSGVPFERVKSRFPHGEAYRAHERGTLDEGAFYQSLRDSIGLQLTDAQFADGWARVLGDEIEPTVALLPRLAARIPCYLFSNTNFAHYALWAKRHAAALLPFRARFISCEMGCRKPDAEAFLQVSQAIGVAPERILFFDDTEANVDGALAAGLRAVWARSHDDIREAVAPWLE
jgi:putative hydrolase of the HAD superfamily